MEPPRPPSSQVIHRPLFYIMRPGNKVVPLIPVDELPGWLQIIQNFPVDPHSMSPASAGQIPRSGEYDIICLYCSAALESLFSPRPTQSSDRTDRPSIGLAELSLMYRGYPGSSIFFFHHHGFQFQNLTWTPSIPIPKQEPGATDSPFRFNPGAPSFSPLFRASGAHQNSPNSDSPITQESPLVNLIMNQLGLSD